MSSRTTRGDPGGLAGVAFLVLGQEPVPAALRVVAAVLLRVDGDEAVAVGGLVHPRRGGEARGVLRAAVQHAHERNGGSGLETAGHVDQRRAAPARRPQSSPLGPGTGGPESAPGAGARREPAACAGSAQRCARRACSIAA